MPVKMASADEVAALRQLLEHITIADRVRLKKRLDGILKRYSAIKFSTFKSLEKDAANSRKIREYRTQALPLISYNEELPVSERREEIAAALDENQILIIAGETGSGKTTQLPKICLEQGRGVAGRIGCTQPRRIAAISVADRVAEELGQQVGASIGYQIRFDAKISRESSVKFMTDGILLSEIVRDRDLYTYDTLIIDEAHERTLNIDFLLGHLQKLCQRRPDLKVIISSATLDVERFSAFFDEAPILSVAGRTYPVELRYRPSGEEDSETPDEVRNAIKEIYDETQTGDILVFLPTEMDIRETSDALNGMDLPRTEVLPLFGRLSSGEQRRVFHPGELRRIILATNVAETSVTVPRIRYVVDTGTARVRRYNHHTQVEHLQIERISRANADQRKGRCGRIAPGICIRLYDEDDYNSRPEYTDPEILRTSLASVILKMKSMGIGEIENFPFIDPPQVVMIRRGYAELDELGALNSKRNLSQLGRDMARLSVEPRYARMLLEGAKRRCLKEMLILAAALSIQDPRERPLEKQAAADKLHKRFFNESSDFIAWLNLWQYFQTESERKGSNSKIRKFCRRNFLNYMRLREWRNIRDQLADEMKELGHKPEHRKGRDEDIHRSLLSGLLSRIGMKTEKRHYQGAHNTAFAIFPGSGLFGKNPPWIMAAEIVETSRFYGRTIAVIRPEWVEKAAGRLCKHSYRDPHWDEKTEHVRAFEQVMLYGLTLVEGRKSHYGPVEPIESRAIFITEALIKGRTRRKYDFLRHNLKLVAEAEELQNKARRKDIAVSEEALFQFYDKRLPEDIYTFKHLNKWLDEDHSTRSASLFMGEADVIMESPDGITPDRFPPQITVDNHTYEIEYNFTPGKPEDGMTVIVPVGRLQSLPAWPFEWLAPGLLGEKIAMCLRELPRRLRKLFVPVPQTVDKILPEVKFRKGHFTDELSRVVLSVTGQRIRPDEWPVDKLPPFLRPNFRIISEEDKTAILAQGRNLEELRHQLRQTARTQFRDVTKERWERGNLSEWNFGPLPERVELKSSAGPVSGFPALIDEGKTVALHLCETPEEATSLLRSGLARLFAIALAPQLEKIARDKPISEINQMYYSARGGKVEGLLENIGMSAICSVFLQRDDWCVREGKEFYERIRQNTKALKTSARQIAVDANAAITAVRETDDNIRSLGNTLPPDIRDDIQSQLSHLVYGGFIAHTPPARLADFPRYVEGLKMRLSRLRHSPQKDMKKLNRFRPYWLRYVKYCRELEEGVEISESALEFRWLVEEFRISTFAQEMGTKFTVSEKLLDEVWQKVAD